VTLPPGVARADLEALFAGEGPVLVALSGGGDSTALLHLLADVAAARVIAGVVDHALRAGSADDARAAAQSAAQCGARAEIARLTWDEGAKRTQEAFRAARYGALAAMAERHGARIIALGHTRDDQAETGAMRAARGAVSGMRRWSALPIWPAPRNIVLARPLLGVRRAALRAWLRARNACWLEDPANENLAYERVRVRATLSEDESTRLAAAPDAAACDDIARDGPARASIAALARIDGPSVTLAAPPPPRALGALIAAAAGAAEAPSAAAAVRLSARLAAPGFRGASLGGAHVRAEGGALIVSRDPGAVLGREGRSGVAPLPLSAGQTAVWDGRLRVLAVGDLMLTADPAQADAPRIEAAGRAFSLTEAQEAGVVQAEWLLAARISHILFTPP